MNQPIPIVYVAHQFGGDRLNLAKVTRWCAFLCQHFNAVFTAPWVPIAQHWEDSGETRRRAVELNHAAVRAADGLIAVGGAMSPGVRDEINVAIYCCFNIASVVDFTAFAAPEDLLADEPAMDYLERIYGRAE